MTDDLLTPAEICELADCTRSALAAWRNRLGFLPRLDEGWQRYTFGDAVAVRLVTILTSHGVTASEAVRIVDTIRGKVNLDGFGDGISVAIGRDLSGQLTAETFMEPTATALDFDGEIVIVIRLASVTWKLFFDICRLRGISPKFTIAGAK